MDETASPMEWDTYRLLDIWYPNCNWGAGRSWYLHSSREFPDPTSNKIKLEVKKRLFEGKNLAGRKDLTKWEKKLILMLVRKENPDEDLWKGERVILMGRDIRTIKARAAAGEDILDPFAAPKSQP